MDSFLVGYCKGVPHSGKQSYFHIALIFHHICECEVSFSSLTATKTKNRDVLRAVEKEFRMYLSSIPAWTSVLCSSEHQGPGFTLNE